MSFRSSIAVLGVAVILLMALTPMVAIVACTAFVFAPSASVVSYERPADSDDQPVSLLAVARFRAPPMPLA
jgi:hypothetical protein